MVSFRGRFEEEDVLDNQESNYLQISIFLEGISLKFYPFSSLPSFLIHPPPRVTPDYGIFNRPVSVEFPFAHETCKKELDRFQLCREMLPKRKPDEPFFLQIVNQGFSLMLET